MPFLVTAEDIESAIIRIDAAAAGVNDVFNASCPKLDAGTKEAWTAWYTGWQQWAALNNNLSYLTLGLPAIGNQAVAYENDVAGWQQDADQICGSQIPILVSQTKIADQNVDVPKGWNMAFDAVKWLSAAVIAALVIPPLVETIHNFHAGRKSKQKS